MTAFTSKADIWDLRGCLEGDALQLDGYWVLFVTHCIFCKKVLYPVKSWILTKFPSIVWERGVGSVVSITSHFVMEVMSDVYGSHKKEKTIELICKRVVVKTRNYCSLDVLAEKG